MDVFEGELEANERANQVADGEAGEDGQQNRQGMQDEENERY